ncbi:MAG: acyl-CoA dehydrogenase family protein, partial [Acidimicrobiia bacterium]
GGQNRSNLARHVVVEELLASGAPVAAHWFAERQVGPSILRYGTEVQRARYLPAITRGELFFAIGLSEPDSGSDLASVRTIARRLDGGWRIDGRKIWTSHAHRAHAILALCRTSDSGGRHEGLSQFLVALPKDGIEVRPIRLMSGEEHFCEVVFDNVKVEDDALLGTEGEGWMQVTSELAFERSGPERLLSTYPLLRRVLAMPIETELRAERGRLAAELTALRFLSASVARLSDEGQAPATQAALVKDLGTRFERQVVELARRVLPSADETTVELYRQAELAAPTFTLRGGTTEIMRGIVSGALVGS